MVQWPALYYLSKGWPVFVALLTVRGILGDSVPLRAQFLLLLTFTIGITPIMAIIQFSGGIVDAMLTTVKIWPFTYYFAFLALLTLLKPSPRQLGRSVLALGAATMLLMPVLWIALPSSWYSTDAVNAKFLLFDVERGYRIYMPMFFGMLFLFYLVRRLSVRRELWVALAVVSCFVILVMVFKQRTSIASAALVTSLILTPARWRRLVVAFLMIAIVIAIVYLFMRPPVETLLGSLGGSLTVRLLSLQSAISYIGSDPLNWLIGKGTTSRFGSVSMSDVLGNAYFFLADIGWIGVIFEYGLIGAALILTLYISGFRLSRKIANDQTNTDHAMFSLAISDYILFMLIQSAVYSLVFVPGEFATLLAIAVYLARFTPITSTVSSPPKEPAIRPSIYFKPPQQVIFHAPPHPKARF